MLPGTTSENGGTSQIHISHLSRDVNEILTHLRHRQLAAFHNEEQIASSLT